MHQLIDSTQPILFLGVGAVALAVQRRYGLTACSGTSRRAPDRRFEQIQHIAATDSAAIKRAAHDALVLVSFPPDGCSDSVYLPLLAGARSVVYLSSTGVYPRDAGHVDEHTGLGDEPGQQARRMAEVLWQTVGASILRLPALYGPTTGLHLRLERGTFRLPPGPSPTISRIHLFDAAAFVAAALAAPPRTLLLAGDHLPAPLAEVVEFVCTLFSYPQPTVAAEGDVHTSLKGNRRIDSRATRQRFGIELTFPTYREGYVDIYRTQRATK
jgi:nucleoside-diphosphate-sugar epimerase